MDAGEDALTESLDPDDQLIIDALVRAREHMGWPHRVQMAEALGVDPSTYNRWEEGTRRVPARILPRLARVTGLSVSALLEERQDGDKPRPEYMARLSRIERQVDELTAFVQRELERRRRQPNSGNEQAAGS